MVDPILMLAGDDLNEVDECWEGIHDQIRAGLLGSLEKELRKLPDGERLRDTLEKKRDVGRNSKDWMNTACQIYGSARRCSREVFGDAAVLTETVLLMYLRVYYHAQVEAWKDDLPTTCRHIAEVLCGKHQTHLRNAIAHGRWELTDDGRKIRFEDRYGNGEVSWGPKDYSLTSVLIDGLVVGALAVALSGFVLGLEGEN